MKRALHAVAVAATVLGGLAVPAAAQRVHQQRAAPPAVVQRAPAQVYRQAPGPVIVYRRPVPRYYYAAPIIAAPAITYYSTYSSGRRFSCDELEYKCDKGAEWACRILERDPNC